MAGIPKTPRSGGPRTDEGRVASSRNALKSGVYSAMVVIPGESEDDFRQMHDQFVADFFPRDIAEGAMVHDLAVLTWKHCNGLIKRNTFLEVIINFKRCKNE